MSIVQNVTSSAVATTKTTTTAAVIASKELSLFEEVFTRHNFIHAFSGMVGGASAITVFFPLNNIRMRVQVDNTFKTDSPFWVGKEIIERDGWQALYQGWWSSVVSLGASNFVYFYVYNAFKTLYAAKILGDKKAKLTEAVILLIGAAAGVINVFATTPLWVVGTRLAVQDKPVAKKPAAAAAPEKAETKIVEQRMKPYDGIWDALVRIAKEESFLSLWKGVGPSLILVSNPTVQFVAYEYLKKIVEKIAEKRGTAIMNWETFVIAAMAKAIATVVTYPLQVAQSKLRADRGHDNKSATSGKEVEKPYANTIDCLQRVLQKEGIAGWFKGIEAKMWQTVLTAAFQITVYEWIVKFVESTLSKNLLKE